VDKCVIEAYGNFLCVVLLNSKSVLEKTHPRDGQAALVFVDQMMRLVPSDWGGNSKKNVGRQTLRRHMRLTRRMARIQVACGWAGVVFSRWASTRTINLQNDPDFETFLNLLKSKGKWLHSKASEILPEKAVELLFSSASGAISPHTSC
jgi:hypothetical protein